MDLLGVVWAWREDNKKIIHRGLGTEMYKRKKKRRKKMPTAIKDMNKMLPPQGKHQAYWLSFLP